MKVIVENEKYGTIEYKENFWTGRRKIYIDGKQYKYKDSNKYVNKSEGKEEVVKVRGGYFSGVRLTVIDTYVNVVPMTATFEYVLALLPFIFVIIWGSAPYFCSLFPIVGGIIGGVISITTGVVQVKIMREFKSVLLKILVAIIMFAVTFILCHLVALVILSLIK